MNDLHSEIITFKQGLPIFQYKQKIQKTICQSNFCVITGDTGSGKSTQLPQYLLDSQPLLASIQSHQSHVNQYALRTHPPILSLSILITQPRRMAAVSMATRVAYQRQSPLGTQIGYTIRFDDKTTPKTRLRYITDGIFIRQCINDPYLFRYQVVILDEAHERSLYTDILFCLVRKAVEYRKGTLKLLVTSATLNTKIFAEYFGGCPVIQMHGRLYPVEVKYFTIKQTARVEEVVKAAIRMHLHQGAGDVLVFLTGSEECESATRMCQAKLEDLVGKGKDVPGMIIYQLYGALSNQDQARIFQKTPEGIRKVVFCTNIAETSLTIDNIGFVIDCGYVKQKSYNPKTNMDSLVTIPISKVQAIQRKGRAGRTQQGKCLRLYSQKFYQQMRDFSLPQILRVSLSSVVLTLKSMKIHNVVSFEYIQSPDKQSIFKALGDLFLLGALNSAGQIQPLGIQMSKFPLQPQFSKAILTSALFQTHQPMITLISLLSTQSIFKRVLRINEQQYSQFLSSQTKFHSPSGDHETLLNVYSGWIKCQEVEGYCTEHFLNARALRQADNIKNQLYQILTGGVNLDICRRSLSGDANYQQFLEIKRHYKDKQHMPEEYLRTVLRRTLAMAFYYNTARLTNDQRGYVLNYPEGTVVGLDPGSVIEQRNVVSPCILYTELGMGNNRGIMRSVSIIDPKWIQPYLKKTKEIDFFRLAGIEVERKTLVQEKQVQTEEVKRKRVQLSRQMRLIQAKERYQARKKIKIE